MSHSVDDYTLLRRAAAGAEAAFTELYARYQGRLFAYFYRRCGADGTLAEDLRQQVFLQLVESKFFRHPPSGAGDLAPLLFSMAANLLKNSYRRQQREARHLAVYREVGTAAAADAGAVPTEKAAQLEAALAALPESQRQAIQLRYRHGLSSEEIGELLDVPPGTIRSRIHYGLKKLNELLCATSTT